MYTFSSKSDEILVSTLICLNLDLEIKPLNINIKFVFSTFKMASVQSLKQVWQDFNFETYFFSLSDWFKLLIPNLICFSFLLPDYLVITCGYLVITWSLLLVTSCYFWFLILVTTILRLFSLFCQALY